MRVDRSEPSRGLAGIHAWLVALLLLSSGPELLAGGRLLRVRNQARGEKSKPDKDEDRKKNRDSESRSQRLREEVREDHDNRRQSPTRSGPRRPRRPTRSPLFLGFHHVPSPYVVEEHVHIYPPTSPGVPLPTVVPPPAPIPPPLPQSEPPFIEGPNEPFDTIAFHPWHLRLMLQYGSNFDDLSQFGFDVLLQAPGSWGLDLDQRMLWESWEPDASDHLWVGDANIVYELIHTPALRMNAGVGVNWLADSIGAEAGVNLTAGYEWWVTDNWVNNGNIDVGTLGATELLHGRATIGRQFEQFEWFLGFDYYSLGGEEISGAMTGLRFRF